MNCVRIVFLLVLWMSFKPAFAQNVQLGFGGAVNTTFFHKAASQYANHFSASRPVLFGGVFVPVNIRFNEAWCLRSGPGFYLRGYHYRQIYSGNGYSGYSFYKLRMHAWELPLLMNFSPGKKTKKYKPDFFMGPVLTYLVPVQNGVGYHAEFSGPGGISLKSPAPAWQNSFSPDICIGSGYSIYKNGRRRYQFNLSYQYSLFNLAGQGELYTEITNTNNVTTTYSSVLRPNLSCLSFNFITYPLMLKRTVVVTEE